MSDAPAIAPLLLDAHDAAKALRIGERTLARLTAAGLIPVVRIGRRVLYDPRDLPAWIEGQKVGAIVGSKADAGAGP